MNSHVLREGFQSYYVIKQERTSEYEQRIMEEGKCKKLLPFDIRKVDGESYYYFKTSGFTTLDEIMTRKKYKIEDYQKVYHQIFDATEQLEEYLLPVEGMVLESNAIFYDERRDEIYFCYLPEQKRDILQQLQDLTEEFLEVINYEDRPLVEYLYGVHEELSKGRLPEVFEEKEVTKEAYSSEEEENGEILLEWIEEEKEEPFQKKAPKVRPSGSWYMQIMILGIIACASFALFSYQMVVGLHMGMTTRRMKILIALAAIGCFHIAYLIRKLRMRTKEESYTTVLTEGENIDNIAENS